MEMAGDRTGGMACASQALYGSATWQSPPTWNQRADGSLPGIRNRRLRPRLEMQYLPGTSFGQEPTSVRV